MRQIHPRAWLNCVAIAALCAAVASVESTLAQETTETKKTTEAEQKDKAQKNPKQKAAQRDQAAKDTEAKREQAGKLYAALQKSWKIEAEQAQTNKNLAAKEAAVQKAIDALAAAEEAAKNSPDDMKLAKKAADAKAAAEKAQAETEAAREVVREKTAAIAAALDEASTIESELIGGLKPISSADWDYAKARHLLFRAGFGGTPGDIERLVAMGPHNAVEFLVEYHQQPAANLELDIRPQGKNLSYERFLSGEARRELNQRRQRNFRNQIAAMRSWWLQRMAQSPRPLEEKLALFWHDHFAVNYRDFNDPYLAYAQNQLFRRYADQYEALLHGVVQDPAMIRYLDNHTNRKGSGNENLGRELQELFSIGEENSVNHKADGYSEDDVREASRALTGYTYDASTGQFRFLGTRYDETQKTVLGKKGNWSGDEVVDVILQHSATAKYVSKKLFEFFVHRNPESDTIDTLAHVLRSNGYDLRPMLKNLFLSQQFYSSEAMGSHIKSPAELLVGTIKVLGLKNVDYGQIDNACQVMGLTLFEPPNVAGWDEGRSWITSKQLLDRYNFIADLVERPTVDVVAALEGRDIQSAADVVDHLAQRFLVAELSSQKRQALIDFLGDLPSSDEWDQQRDQINAKLRAVIVMLLGTPEYQVS